MPFFTYGGGDDERGVAGGVLKGCVLKGVREGVLGVGVLKGGVGSRGVLRR